MTTAPTSIKSVSQTGTHIRLSKEPILDCTESDKATFKCFTASSFRNYESHSIYNQDIWNKT